MPIYQYHGYITREEAALRYKVQVRTINDWIRKTSPAPASFSLAKIGGYIYIKDPSVTPVPPPGIRPDTLEWVHNFARRNKITYERVYEEIIAGRISAVMLLDRVFVINNEPELAAFVAGYKKKSRDLRR